MTAADLIPGEPYVLAISLGAPGGAYQWGATVVGLYDRPSRYRRPWCFFDILRPARVGLRLVRPDQVVRPATADELEPVPRKRYD